MQTEQEILQGGGRRAGREDLGRLPEHEKCRQRCGDFSGLQARSPKAPKLSASPWAGDSDIFLGKAGLELPGCHVLRLV